MPSICEMHGKMSAISEDVNRYKVHLMKVFKICSMAYINFISIKLGGGNVLCLKVYLMKYKSDKFIKLYVCDSKILYT